MDLSLPIGAGTQVYPGDPVPRLEQHSTIGRDGFNLLSVRMGSQTGTHVDAPYHFDGATPKIDELPLERFVGTARIVDLLGLAARESIGWELLEGALDEVAPGTIVVLHTGWSRYYGTDRYFDHPYLHPEACRRLIDRGVRTFGIDAINLDETPDEDHPGAGFPVHHLIAEAGGVICENLTNLEAVDFDDPFLSVLPLALESADGAPVRAVAMRLDEGG